MLCHAASGVRCASDINYYRVVREQYREASRKGLKYRLRWIDDHTCDVCKLFGSPVRAGRLRLSDGILKEWASVVQIRDGVVIDRDSQTAVDGLKYEYEVIPPGSRFELHIDLDNPRDQDMALLGAALFEWRSGSSIGGFTSRGLGRFHLDEIKLWGVDLSDPRQRMQFLKATKAGRPVLLSGELGEPFFRAHRAPTAADTRRGRLTMLRRLLCQADVTLEIEPVDPLLVKSGYASWDGPDMVPVSTFRNGRPVHYVPGTSLKGVLRSHLERVARTLRQGSVCLPYHSGPESAAAVPIDEEKASYGCGFRSRTGGKDAASFAYADSCAACRLFGSLKFAGRFSIGDAYPLPDQEPTVEQRNGVGINRFTGGTEHGVLFELQALVGGRFKAHIRLTNFELWQLAGLKLLLVDLEDEMIAVGSGRSRGMGRVRAGVTSVLLTYLGTEASIVGIGQLATPQERDAYRLHDWTPDQPVALPTPESRGLRRQYDLDADWSQRLQTLVPAFESFLQWHGPQGSVSDNRDSNRNRA